MSGEMEDTGKKYRARMTSNFGEEVRNVDEGDTYEGEARKLLKLNLTVNPTWGGQTVPKCKLSKEPMKN